MSLSSTRWTQLWESASAKGDHLPWFDDLNLRYAEPHRHYHTARHIAECLDEWDRVRHLAKDPIALEFSIWYHDAIYDPRAAENEARSSALAEACLISAGLPALVPEVKALIMSTQTHDVSQHADAELLSDIDLSILGREPERFWEYEEQIRKEYAFVPQTVFSCKRAEILQEFLQRPKMFRTAFFIGRFESQARLNLQASIARLLGQ